MGNGLAHAPYEMVRYVTYQAKRRTPDVQSWSGPLSIESWTLSVWALEMPGRGLEPLRISPPDPKSGASANFATLAG
jgi:hypothetical protein